MCESVSTVPPDFDETTKSVFWRSILPSTSRTAPGSVESSTCSRGEPGMSPKERRITSGPRLEPPMPSSTTSLNFEHDSANERRSSPCSSIFSLIVSQPRRSPISGPGPPQSDSSLRQTFWATPSLAAVLPISTSCGSSSSGIEERMVGGLPVTTPSRTDSIPATSLSKGSTNLAIPSRSSLSVTSFMSMPALRSAVRSSTGSWSAVAPLTSDFSAAASSVGIGIVLTVSGATRSSTYLVSEYCGSLTPVDAQSGRWTGQPASRSDANRSPRKSSLKRW